MALACEQIRNEFSALLDDELNSEDRELVEEHLFECADCLRELHGFKQVSDAYRFHHPVKAPDDFEALLREAMNPGASRRAYARSPWLLAVAATVLVAFSLFLWRVSEDDPGSFQMSRYSEESALEEAPQALLQQAEPMREGGRSAADDIGADSAEIAESGAFESLAGAADTMVSDDAAPAPPEMEPLTQPEPAPASPPPASLRREAPAPPMAESIEVGDEANAAAGSVEADVAERDLGGSSASARTFFKAEAQSPMAESVPPPPAEPMPVMWRDRPFNLVDGVLQQDGYNAEALTLVARPSEAWTALLYEYPDLAQLVGGAHPVVVQLDETWYRIDVPGVSGQ